MKMNLCLALLLLPALLCSQILTAVQVSEKSLASTLPKETVFKNTATYAYAIDSIFVEPSSYADIDQKQLSLSFRMEHLNAACIENAVTSVTNPYPRVAPKCPVYLAPGDSLKFSDFEIDACHCGIKPDSLSHDGDTIKVNFSFQLINQKDKREKQGFKVKVTGVYKLSAAIRKVDRVEVQHLEEKDHLSKRYSVIGIECEGKRQSGVVLGSGTAQENGAAQSSGFLNIK